MDGSERVAGKARGFSVFETAIGYCGIAWTDDAIAGAQLPDHDETTTRARMRGRFPGVPEAPPPDHALAAIDAIRALLSGEPRDLSGVVLEMDGVPEFDARVYDVARAIAPGTTLSYGEIAARLGDPGAARAVGRALGNNPFAPIVPCHRVVAADGKMHGFSAPGGVAVKLRMLRGEGWRANEPTLFD
ncbi:MAG TPA: methylated-DNA--[protein]-cysteine S-methyltransferase [Candidatus Elarobacter sp.]|jgi:methylated-DNA-[protein]-cysteine S-methyltransferase|nr:methylated-DNA--[protein]-cysteine S-methyltransferase [Candidatus Elarobacter sp.]